MHLNKTPSNPSRRITRRTLLRTLVGTTALAGGPALPVRAVAQNDGDDIANAQIISADNTVAWELYNNDIIEWSLTGGRLLGTYANETVESPDGEPVCEWAGGEEVGTFWEVDSGAAVVIVAGAVARMRRTLFHPTYAFAGPSVMETGPFADDADILATARETNLSTVNALTKSIIALLVDGECELGDGL